MDPELIAQLSLFEMVIPAWQMAFYIIVISLCMFNMRYKLGLIITYCFCLYWGFFLYWGDIIGSFSKYPGAVMLYIASGFLLVILMVIACFRGD